METRKEVVNLIKILGYPYSEVVMEFTTENYEISSIAYIAETDKIILYKWYSDYEFQISYDDLNTKDQKKVLFELSKFISN